MSSFNAAEQSSVNSRNRVTDMELNEGTLGSQRGRMAYAATARSTQSFSLRYLLADGWSTPVTPCKKNANYR